MNKPIRLTATFFLAFVYLSINSFPQNKSIELDKLFKYYEENARFSGVVLAAENGRIIYKKAFGFSDFESKKLLDTTFVFNIASTTKPFTALAIMMLKERGQLSYDDKLLKFLPDFPAYAKDITIRHLLTHTSGVTDYVNEMHLDRILPVLTTKLVYDSLIVQQSLNFAPGEKYSYSNSGYFLLALIIEKVSGKSYREFMVENIFKPLGMNNTYAYDESVSELPNRVNAYIGYWQKNEDDINLKVPGDGNIYSTASDLFLFDQALYSSKLIQQQTMVEAYDTANLFTLKNNGLKYGYGWNILPDTAGTIVYHVGSAGGFRCQFWRNLDKKNTLIILSNNTSIQFNTGILSGAQRIMKEEPYTLDKISIAELFYEILFSDGFDVAIKKIKEAKENNNPKYIFPEMEINNLGYYMMYSKNEPLHALELFKFNVKLYPESGNVYDSLGEAYLQIGDNTLAAEAYQKSIQLDPDNTNAANILNNLGVNK